MPHLKVINCVCVFILLKYFDEYLIFITYFELEMTLHPGCGTWRLAAVMKTKTGQRGIDMKG
jgi:hypothetical protein